MFTTLNDISFFQEVQHSDDPNFATQLRDAIRNNKLVHLSKVPNDIDHMKYYENLVDQLGEIVNVDEDALSGDSKSENRWTDIRYDIDYATKTFRHSNTRQPLHTDAAYTNFDLDVNFFFCVTASEYGGATTFIDSPEIIEMLKKYYSELYEKLTTTEVKFQKGADQGKVRKIIDKDERGIKFNWNYFRVSEDNTPEVKEMCEEFHQFLESRIVDGAMLLPVRMKPGECVFFHDDRLLHGRTSFLGSRNLIKGGFNFTA